MIYIIEVPHQRRARCWVAANKSDFCRIVQRFADKTAETIDSYEMAVDFIKMDLHAFAVFESDAEAVDAFFACEHPIFTGHQGGRAWDEFRSKLVYHDVIDETDGED